MDEQMRASDADRDAAAAALHGHFAAGRLNSGELDERVATALEARTTGELNAVLADLPQGARGHAEPAPGRLERRYRRLLACYPAAWRQAHGQEMVAVLMADAPAGRRRPAPGDAASMIAGGLLVRCQRTRFGGQPAWRDALAVVSVLLPLVLLATFAVGEAWLFHHFAQIPGPAAERAAAAQLTVPLALAVMALLRHYRGAALTIAALGIGLAVLAGWTSVQPEYTLANPYGLLAIAVQILAVTASPGPSRGLALLTGRGTVLAVIAAAAIAAAGYPRSVAVVVLVAAVMLASSSLGRWLLLLLAVPLWPYLTSYAYPAYTSKIALRLDIRPLVSLNNEILTAMSWQGQFYLIPAVLLGLFAAAAYRDSVRWRSLVRPAG